jgi:O-antigen/teichoic acid export membrane protein
LLVGLLIKLVLNIPLIKLFETQGAVIATTIGYAVAIVINLYVIKKYARYKFELIIRRSVAIGIINAVMAVVVLILYGILKQFLNPASGFQAVILVVICGGAGALVYFYLSLRSKLADKLFGDRISRIRSRLRIG